MNINVTAGKTFFFSNFDGDELYPLAIFFFMAVSPLGRLITLFVLLTTKKESEGKSKVFAVAPEQVVRKILPMWTHVQRATL